MDEAHSDPIELADGEIPVAIKDSQSALRGRYPDLVVTAPAVTP